MKAMTMREVAGLISTSRRILGFGCGVRGCSNRVEERKPFCPEHVEKIPSYADKKREVELRDGNPLTIMEDVRAALAWHGALTFGGLAKELTLKTRDLAPYIEDMAQAGRVVIEERRDRRGHRLKFVKLAS